jgi:WD40 repeat protein|mmetsp:Transcript_47835/g.63242  ORF Transcript_47835/g.63242 Transcript_47835/m.63242 type:complete len:83 (+) Transcript_47835:1147-1395(+)
MKELIMSNIDKSHKNYVADIKFVPGSVKVDRKMPNDGKSYHFVSCAEDGTVNIWDTRNIEIAELKNLAAKGKAVVWTPFLTI